MIPINIKEKIKKQLEKRGWDEQRVVNTINNPYRTVPTRDTRYASDGSRRDDPATGYVNADGSYVIRNDRTGDIVQVSDHNNPDWKAPWHEHTEPEH